MKLMTHPGWWKKGLMGEDYAMAVLYLAPARTAGTVRNHCPGHSPECLAHCLIYSGQMPMPNAVEARRRKTVLFEADPAEFGRLLHKDVDAHLRWCRKHEQLPAFRFNGTSDIAFEEWVVPHLGVTLHEYLLAADPDAMVNEYTKRFSAMKRWLGGEYPSNLHMTFSRSEINDWQCRIILAMGGNVSVVFDTRKGERLPSTWEGRPVIDGDVDDLRWMDKERARRQGIDTGRGLIVGLKFKQNRKGVPDSPFIVKADTRRIVLPIAA
jgi:hypothetical protein